MVSYRPMYPFHASPSLPGPIQAWTVLKNSQRACSLHDSPFFLCSLLMVFLSLFPLHTTSFLDSLPLSDRSPSNTTGHFTAWSCDCQSSSPGVSAWLEVQWEPGVIWVELIVLFSLPFNNTKPHPANTPPSQISQPPQRLWAPLRMTKVHVQAKPQVQADKTHRH